MSAQLELQQQLQSIETLIGRINAAANPDSRACTRELVQLIMDLHGTGVARILELIDLGPDGGATIDKLGRDELVSSLLILHGLHPLSTTDRVLDAVEKVRLEMKAQGDIEVLDLDENMVRLRIHAIAGHGSSCGGGERSMRAKVEEALLQAAPDIGVSIEDSTAGNVGFVPLSALGSVPVAAGVVK